MLTDEGPGQEGFYLCRANSGASLRRSTQNNLKLPWNLTLDFESLLKGYPSNKDAKIASWKSRPFSIYTSTASVRACSKAMVAPRKQRGTGGKGHHFEASR